MTTIKERFDILIKHYAEGNKSKFASKIGVVPTVVENIVGVRQGNPSFTLLRNLLAAFPEVNPNWLIAGSGEMFKDNNTIVTIPVEETHPNAIYLYDVSAAAGYSNFDEMISKERAVGKFVVPTFQDISWMIYVRGSSMYPKYSSGDIIACRVLYESQFIQWGKVYVVATREQGILVKRLKKSDKDNCITAVSDNRAYDTFDIPKDEILGIALVVGVIRLE